MKVSVSLTQNDLATLDRYAAQAGLPSRSAAVQRAIRMLDEAELESAYEAAWNEWEATGEKDAWDTTTADGLNRAAR
ncbi:CopG family ribbon-helix-helix protein [Tersicoccus sp. Bi-70]|uniref:CopG family ribbon-helix-helix protein n=1 Tax=Tersicoccus sp. Bi-70 TaxID=1897634 RepID=UPI000977F46F|nr:ribbon-helix-helix protein, CopG family [Tersicoccus sp. Bi-70]OMH36842.1 antitoxin [Tersicoccus sp. Bi-70]